MSGKAIKACKPRPVSDTRNEEELGGAHWTTPRIHALQMSLRQFIQSLSQRLVFKYVVHQTEPARFSPSLQKISAERPQDLARTGTFLLQVRRDPDVTSGQLISVS